MNIVFIGMSGSGKTTLAKELALTLGKDFYDIDKMIVEREGRAIEEIFQKDGEEYFRDLESLVIRDIAFKDDLIIATGGGSILRKKNVDLLKKNGTFLYLQASLDTLYNNLIGSNEIRPLIHNKNSLNKVFMSRKEIYEKLADHTINVDNKTIEEIIELIIALNL